MASDPILGPATSQNFAVATPAGVPHDQGSVSALVEPVRAPSVIHLVGDQPPEKHEGRHRAMPVTSLIENEWCVTPASGRRRRAARPRRSVLRYRSKRHARVHS